MTTAVTRPHTVAARIDTADAVGSAVRLVFRASDRIRSHEDAAEAAFEVGNDQGADDIGQTWPGNIRSVSVGDVIKITGSDARTVHLSVDSCGFSPVPEPTTLVALTGPRVTHRD